jgi:hypothetical protein
LRTNYRIRVEAKNANESAVRKRYVLYEKQKFGERDESEGRQRYKMRAAKSEDLLIIL